MAPPLVVGKDSGPKLLDSRALAVLAGSRVLVFLVRNADSLCRDDGANKVNNWGRRGVLARIPGEKVG
jgi:hypothetical protein